MGDPTRDVPVVAAGIDVVDLTAAVLQFGTGAIGGIATTRRLASAIVEVEFATPDLLATILLAGDNPRLWEIVVNDGQSGRTIPPGREPYEAKAAVFLDAVKGPTRPASSCPTRTLFGPDRLTRAVAAAVGRAGRSAVRR